MDRGDVKELHFITYTDNVPSIIQYGILCHNKARKLKNYRDISEATVQELRARKKIPGTKKKLHDYANLYFDAHNPMLSKRRSENNEICVLRIDSAILDLEDVIVTDRNAARTSESCWFKPVYEGLPLLKKDEIYAVWWTKHDTENQIKRHAGIKCAEILVPNVVQLEYIFGAYVANNIALQKFESVSSLDVKVNGSLFFLRGD